MLNSLIGTRRGICRANVPGWRRLAGHATAAIRPAAATVADSFSPKGNHSVARTAAAVAAEPSPHLDLAPEDVRPGGAGLVHFHAELGAQVGDDGGGSADGKEGRGERGEGRGI